MVLTPRGIAQVNIVDPTYSAQCALMQNRGHFETSRDWANTHNKLFAGCSMFQQHAKCTSGTDLLRLFPVLSHRDKSYRSSVLPHSVTVD